MFSAPQPVGLGGGGGSSSHKPINPPRVHDTAVGAAGCPPLALDIHVVNPALRPSDMPSMRELEEEFDGVAWTGCSLTIHEVTDPVAHQIGEMGYGETG